MNGCKAVCQSRCRVADLNSDPLAKRKEMKRSRGWQLPGQRGGAPGALGRGPPRLTRAVTDISRESGSAVSSTGAESRGRRAHTCVNECVCVCARARLCALWGPAWCAATGGGCASHGSRDAIQCSRSRGRCGGATILLPELRAVACTRPLAYSTLLLPPPPPQPPLPPPANASSLQLPPSAPPSAPPSPLAPEANPAPEDQPQPPPPLPLAPPADHNSSPGTRWLGGGYS